MHRQQMITCLLITFTLLLLCGCVQQTTTQENTTHGEPIVNQPPQILRCTVEYLNESSPLEVMFSSSAVDYDGSIVSYRWSISDGTTSNKSTFTHTFQNEGTYYARLTVIDNDQATDSRTIPVVIRHSSE